MKDAINMTIQDAIQEIDGLVHAAMREYNIKDEEDAYDEEALGVAVWAMNKQIPMKPVKEPRPNGRTNICCPNCNCEAVRPVEYCWRCGQKQDWEEIE